MRISLPSRVDRFAVVLLAAVAAVLFALALPAGARATEACPNEQLRIENNSTGLPECRTYEQVTPVFKNGSVRIRGLGYTSDGQRIAYEADGGGFAEPGIDTDGKVPYVSQRTSAGWLTVAAEPAFGVDGAEPNYTTSFGSTDLTKFAFPFTYEASGTAFGQIWIQEVNGSAIPALAELPNPSKESFASVEGVSANMSTIVFNPEVATPLLPTDTNSPQNEARLYEITSAGTPSSALRLVGVTASGALIGQCGVQLGSAINQGLTGSNVHSTYDAVSADGTRVFATVFAGPTVVSSTQTSCGSGSEIGYAPRVNEVIAQSSDEGAVNISEPSVADCSACNASTGLASALYEGASRDGSKVFFTTEQELLVGQTTKNIYEYNFDAPVGERIVLVSGGSTKPEVQGVVRISEDGSHVYFVASGVLTSAQNGEGDKAMSGAENLYVDNTETNEVSFVGLLCSGSGKSGSLVFPSREYADGYCPSASLASDAALWGTDGGQEVQDGYTVQGGREAQATSDGQYFVFTSYAALTSGKTSTTQAVYEYDAASGALVRVSIGRDGYESNGNSNTYSATIPRSDFSSIYEPSVASERVVTENGLEVFFESPEALVQGAIAGNQHIYEYREGTVSLISGVEDPVDSATPVTTEDTQTKLLGVTPSGGDVYFVTNQALLSKDEDGQADIYDARVDGGFRAPAPRPSCSGEECQEPYPSAPAFEASSTSSFSGGVNVAPPPTGIAPALHTKVNVAPASLTKAEKLANALMACKRDKRKKKRASCEQQVRKRYGSTGRSKKAKGKKSARKVRR